MRRVASGEPRSLKSQDSLSYTSIPAKGKKQNQFGTSTIPLNKVFQGGEVGSHIQTQKHTPEDLIYIHFIKFMRHV